MKKWYPVNKGDQNSGNILTDAQMSLHFRNRSNIGWEVKKNSDTSVSVYKNGRYIRDYEFR